MVSYILLILAMVLNAAGSILLKIGSRNIGSLEGLALPEILTRLLSNIYLIGGISLFALNVIFYFFALSRLNLSVAYPIMVTGGIVIITLFSFFIFKEHISSYQFSGIVLIMIGIALLTYKTV